MPAKRTRAYDMRKVVERICDPGSVMLLQPGFARSVVTALARLESLAPRGMKLTVKVLRVDDDKQKMRAAIEAGVSAYVVTGLPVERVNNVLDVALARKLGEGSLDLVDNRIDPTSGTITSPERALRSRS